jgi:hypothetical protein
VLGSLMAISKSLRVLCRQESCRGVQAALSGHSIFCPGAQLVPSQILSAWWFDVLRPDTSSVALVGPLSERSPLYPRTHLLLSSCCHYFSAMWAFSLAPRFPPQERFPRPVAPSPTRYCHRQPARQVLLVLHPFLHSCAAFARILVPVKGTRLMFVFSWHMSPFVCASDREGKGPSHPCESEQQLTGCCWKKHKGIGVLNSDGDSHQWLVLHALYANRVGRVSIPGTRPRDDVDGESFRTPGITCTGG